MPCLYIALMIAVFNKISLSFHLLVLKESMTLSLLVGYFTSTKTNIILTEQIPTEQMESKGPQKPHYHSPILQHNGGVLACYAKVNK